MVRDPFGTDLLDFLFFGFFRLFGFCLRGPCQVHDGYDTEQQRRPTEGVVRANREQVVVELHAGIEAIHDAQRDADHRADDADMS